MHQLPRLDASVDVRRGQVGGEEVFLAHLNDRDTMRGMKLLWLSMSSDFVNV